MFVAGLAHPDRIDAMVTMPRNANLGFMAVTNSICIEIRNRIVRGHLPPRAILNDHVKTTQVSAFRLLTQVVRKHQARSKDKGNLEVRGGGGAEVMGGKRHKTTSPNTHDTKEDVSTGR